MPKPGASPRVKRIGLADSHMATMGTRTTCGRARLDVQGVTATVRSSSGPGEA